MYSDITKMVYLPGQVFCISPGVSARATRSLSRLTSRRLSNRERLARILLRRTASTSMVPFEDPSTTFSTLSSVGTSVYFAMSASKNDTPYEMTAFGRMKEPAFFTLKKNGR